ncbi:arsenate reductase/protein-tyrosine-phosphatase family protein [Halalkalirubrum salinum]|uniref:arsenate reductase/protein-tyrosine-phosphatase family protein n=1 Tax=Halalkalirubrum salinum TaxID=2563889 RepID=UPI0010FB9AB8|nr:low molecular weight phosphotyrosine protein phosphatase [Halalkalirubrum salinum]
MAKSPLVHARNRAGIGLQRLRLSLGSGAPIDASALIESTPTDPNVLFLCYGNICRSPFGERYLQRTLAEHDTEDISVDSAGLKATDGRKSPENAVSAASEFDVDLSGHRSKPVTEQQLQWADTVFVMDLLNYYYLRRDFADYGETVFFLGALADGDSYEIPDPYGDGVSRYRMLYGELTTAVDRFVDHIDSQR